MSNSTEKKEAYKANVASDLAVCNPGTLNIIGGLPGTGKTTFAFRLAVEAQMQTAYFSMKMTGEKLLSQHAPVDHPDWIHIDDTPSLTPRDVQKKTLQLKEKYDIKLVVIDYLQLMNSSQPHTDSSERQTSILNELKEMATELQVAVIVLSQIAQKPESEKGDFGFPIPSCVDNVRVL